MEVNQAAELTGDIQAYRLMTTLNHKLNEKRQLIYSKIIATETNTRMLAEKSGKEKARAEDVLAGRASGFHGVSDFKPKFTLANLNSYTEVRHFISLSNSYYINGSKDAEEQQALLQQLIHPDLWAKVGDRIMPTAGFTDCTKMIMKLYEEENPQSHRLLKALEAKF